MFDHHEFPAFHRENAMVRSRVDSLVEHAQIPFVGQISRYIMIVGYPTMFPLFIIYKGLYDIICAHYESHFYCLK